MIFGFSIHKGIPDDLALKILSDLGGDANKTTNSFNTPINNPIRNFSISYFVKTYIFYLNINAGVLINGKETVDIEFVNEPDFSILDKKFTNYFAEIIGQDNSEKLPPLREWGLGTMRYGMDIKVDHINDIMQVFTKTDMPEAHLNPQNAIDITNTVPAYLYRETGKKDGRLEIYPKSDLIELGYIDYKGRTGHITEETYDTVRLVLNHFRRHMGYAKRFMTKFELDLWQLDSFLNPLVVTNTFIKAYLDTIGSGNFYTYEDAVKIIENEVSSLQNRSILNELLNNINEKGSIAKAREASADKIKFKKDLQLLRDIGINGALLDSDIKFKLLKNPFNEILDKCKVYSNEE